MNAEERPWPPTPGERWDARGRHLADRLLPALPWAGPLGAVIDRLISRSAPHDGRFERSEVEAADTPSLARGRSVRQHSTVPSPVHAQAAPQGPGDAGQPPAAGLRSRLQAVTAARTGLPGATIGHTLPHTTPAVTAAHTALPTATIGPTSPHTTPPGGHVDSPAAPLSQAHDSSTPHVPGPPQAHTTTTPQGPGRAGHPLPPDVRSRLRDVTGSGTESLRVHHDEAADGLARAHGADAVTVGPHVHFRQGRFRPREKRGFALLAHEATHVLALLHPDTPWHRATGGGRRDEEDAALAHERAALHAGPVPLPSPYTDTFDAPSGPAAPARAHMPTVRGPAGPALPASSTAHPMTAATDRNPDLPLRPAPSPTDLEALRRGLLNDVMRRLRSEFERGG